MAEILWLNYEEGGLGKLTLIGHVGGKRGESSEPPT